MNQRQLGKGRRGVGDVQGETGRQRLDRGTENDIVMGKCRQDTRGCRFSCGSIAGLGSPWTLFTGQILLGETLLARLALPIVIPYPSAVDNDTATKLSEHGASGDNSDLAGPVGIRQDILLDQVVLFDLRRDDLVQRPVLVEQEVRVAVVQHSCALRSQHEELGASVGHTEGAALVFASALQISHGVYLGLSGVVELFRNVLIAFIVQLVGRVIAHGRKGLDKCLIRGGLVGR